MCSLQLFSMNFCCPESYLRNSLSSKGSQQFRFKRFKTTIQCRDERLSLRRKPDARLAQAVNCKSTIDPAASCQQFQSLRHDVHTHIYIYNIIYIYIYMNNIYIYKIMYTYVMDHNDMIIYAYEHVSQTHTHT